MSTSAVILGYVIQNADGLLSSGGELPVWVAPDQGQHKIWTTENGLRRHVGMTLACWDRTRPSKAHPYAAGGVRAVPVIMSSRRALSTVIPE